MEPASVQFGGTYFKQSQDGDTMILPYGVG